MKMTNLLILLALLAIGALGLLALLRASESRLIYFPLRELDATPSLAGLSYEDVSLVARDGTRLHGWWVPGGTGPAVLFLHGNAGNISHRLEKLVMLHELGATVFLVDYRGYGRSAGRPSEAGLYLDARAAYEHATGTRGVAPTNLVLYGESLGTAVAVDLATSSRVSGVILESGFTSLLDVGRELYPALPVRWVATSRFDTVTKIARLEAPLLVLHSEDDEFFGIAHAERLVDTAPGPKRLVKLRGGHNDAFLVSRTTYVAALRQFLDSLQRR